MRFSIYDLQGRQVWRSPATEAEAGMLMLAWPGITRDGAVARPGLYLARVELGAHRYARRVLLVR